MPKMGVNPEQTKAQKPVPGNQWYKLRIKSLHVKKSPKGYNYEAYLNVVENTAENNDAFVLFRMNNGFMQPKAALDFTHAAGLTLEDDGSFPGDFVLKDPAKPDDFDGAQYNGPLLGRTIEAELVIDEYNGEFRNAVKQLRCAVNGCATKYPDIKHQTDLMGKKKK